jgi:hypothetical protein
MNCTVCEVELTTNNSCISLDDWCQECNISDVENDKDQDFDEEWWKEHENCCANNISAPWDGKKLTTHLKEAIMKESEQAK